MKSASRWTGVALVVSLSAAVAGAQTTERVSVGSGGAQGNGVSEHPSLSADGRFVAFWSRASNLVAGDTNGTDDVYVRDRQSGTTERVSVSSSAAQGDSGSYDPAMSPDGRFVVFASNATNLVAGDANGYQDIFVHDRQLGTTELVSVDSGGGQGADISFNPSISADGRFVVFTSEAANLVFGDTNSVLDVFVRDRLLGTTGRVSVSSSGLQGNSYSGMTTTSISADGRYVVFGSYASNLVAADPNSQRDVFVHDRQSGTTELVSVALSGLSGNSFSEGHRMPISADGRFVAFDSHASDLVAGDTNSMWDVFLRDRVLGTTERISIATGGAEGNSVSLHASLSVDAHFVSFMSQATNMVAGDVNGKWDIFRRDRVLGTTELVSLASSGAQSNQFSVFSSLSADGRFVAFDSMASNLVAGDTNVVKDIFVRDALLPPVAFCFGDGSPLTCPCGNNGLPGHGCENSFSTGGAVLGATGGSALAGDTLVLTSSGETPPALSIFLQGDSVIAAASFGDGLRCIGGSLKRLYVHSALGGIVSAPQAGDPSISARSAALGDVLTAGSLRHYQTYYRDPTTSFCPNPPGNVWNISSGLSVLWSP